MKLGEGSRGKAGSRVVYSEVDEANGARFEGRGKRDRREAVYHTAEQTSQSGFNLHSIQENFAIGARGLFR